MMQQKLPWIVTAVLAGLLIIVTFLWLDAVAKLDGGNLSAQKDLIREACSKTDEASRATCQEELADMENMLKTFAKDLKDNKPEATIDLVATTTATTTKR